MCRQLVLKFSEVLQLPYSNISWFLQNSVFGDPPSEAAEERHPNESSSWQGRAGQNPKTPPYPALPLPYTCLPQQYSSTST